MFCVLGAATQMDVVDHVATESTSGRSDSGSVAQTRATHIRLEQRLMRPAVCKIQVNVNLDGATNSAMAARLRRNGMHGRAQRGRGMEADPEHRDIGRFR